MVLRPFRAFAEVHPDINGEDLDWSPNRELLHMKFSYTGELGSELIWVFHATNKINPLVRAWTFRDPDTEEYQPWTMIRANTL
ncbi:MAG: hypothetical protein KZQ92_20630 [Candidatus Thiodiazotropha sp. (ex Lucinoma borealis)]|nr:hypothetical protein [Candidatus Thiodiazotropha sp. (ex Lucinoma borealis)]MCU7866370.1 hypothetical protein [Candidatus Thiodiazotropha sp. (ex Lucinoma borealis)]